MFQEKLNSWLVLQTYINSYLKQKINAVTISLFQRNINLMCLNLGLIYKNPYDFECKTTMKRCNFYKHEKLFTSYLNGTNFITVKILGEKHLCTCTKLMFSSYLRFPLVFQPQTWEAVAIFILFWKTEPKQSAIWPLVCKCLIL